MQEPIKEDHYQTIERGAGGEYKEKGSKFLAFVQPVNSVEETKIFLEELKKKYHDARHHCFAYRIDPEDPQIRANDDGEPSNSAGMPIFNQLQSFDLWNVMAVVVRYFGGTKLGVSGLINAYKTATQDALTQCKITRQFLTISFSIDFPYKLMNEVMRLIKEEELEIIAEHMGIKAGYTLAVRKGNYEKVLERIGSFHEIKVNL